MSFLLLNLALALDCPDGTTAIEGRRAQWCVAGDGTVHGPVRMDHRGALEGTVEHGVQVGTWTLTWPDGTNRAVSPVSGEPGEVCGTGDGDCLVQAASDELARWPKRTRFLATPGFRLARSQAHMSIAGETYVDFWSQFRLAPDLDERKGFGLPAGKTTVWNREGRVILTMMHDEAGALTGTFAYHDRRGRPLRRAHYLHGWLHGKEEVWGLGVREGEVHWKGNALHGPLRWWDTDGRQIIQGGFMEGEPCSPFAMKGVVTKGLRRNCMFVNTP